MAYWLRIGEAARLLDLSVDTLRKWDREGRLRARRTRGDHRRYALPDIQTLAGKRARGTPPLDDRRAPVTPRSSRITPRSLRYSSRIPREPSPMDPATALALRRLRAETTP